MSLNPKKKRRYPFKRKLNRKMRRIIFMVVAAAIASGVNYYNKHHSVDKELETLNSSIYIPANEQLQAIAKIRAAQDDTNAQFWIGLNGKVVRILKDDLSGSRHQKFLISPAEDITLLIAHNIDLAPRVEVSKNDRISIYGRYEWNNRGGVIHWTHHDPKGKKQGGWIKANGKTYR